MLVNSFVIHVLTNCIFLVIIWRSFQMLKINNYYKFLTVLYLSYLIYDVINIYNEENILKEFNLNRKYSKKELESSKK